MRRLLRAENSSILLLPLLLMAALVVTAFANVKLAHPAPPAALCGAIVGPSCWSTLPLQTFVTQLPLLSLAMVLASLLLAVLGTYWRRHGISARDGVIACLLQLAPAILLVLVGLLACVLVCTVWLPIPHPFFHPY